MKKLTPIQKSAKGEDCALRIPGVCNSNPETTVLCHAPYTGKFGSRSHDWWAAYGCSDCHDAVDHRSGKVFLTADLWHNAIHETQTKLQEKGLIWLGGEIQNKVLPRR